MCVCILALVTRHAKRMRRIILSSVAGQAVSYIYVYIYIFFFFSTFSGKARDFRGKKLLNINCVLLIFSTIFI
jgi:hypothetical protein